MTTAIPLFAALLCLLIPGVSVAADATLTEQVSAPNGRTCLRFNPQVLPKGTDGGDLIGDSRGTFTAGNAPEGVVFDGLGMWAANSQGNTL